MKDKAPAYVPPDYTPGRTLALESQINQAFAATFRPDAPAAMLVLAYLTETFLNRIVGPGGSDAELRHREGQRDLVRIIKQRIDHGRNGQPKLPDPADAANAGR